MPIEVQVLCLAFFSLWPTKWDRPVEACHTINNTHQVLQQEKSDYDIELLVALFKKESNFKHDIGPNKAGACGLGQQIPKYTHFYTDKTYTCQEIKADPKVSIALTIKALDYLKKESARQWEDHPPAKPLTENGLYHVLCMYNQGTRSTCKEWRGSFYGTSYTRSIISTRNKLREKKEEIYACLAQGDLCELEVEFPDEFEAHPYFNVINEWPPVAE